MNEILIHMMVYPLFLKCLQPPSWTFTLRLQQAALVVKNLPANAGDTWVAGLILRSGRSPGQGHGNPLQYSCLENPTDRGAWWVTVHRVAKSWTRLKQLGLHACTYFILHLFPENSEEALNLNKLQFVKFWKACFTFFAARLGSPQGGLESPCEKRSPSWLT